jgi:hypothetical protein
MFMAVLNRRSLIHVAREKEIRRVAPSQRDHPVNCFAGIARKNHDTEKCWKLQNKKKRNSTSKPKDKIDGSASIASDNSSNNVDALITFVGCASDDAHWILDSACSYHVCISRDLSSTYEPMQSGGIV